MRALEPTTPPGEDEARRHRHASVARSAPVLSTVRRLLEWSRAYVVAAIGRADFWSSTLPALRVLLPSGGVISEREASDYVDKLEMASMSKTFFASCHFYSMVARACTPAEKCLQDWQ